MNKLKKLFIGTTDPTKNKDTFISYSTTPIVANNNRCSILSIARPVQNFCLVWLDSNIDEVNDDDTINTIKQLRRVVNTIEKFTNINECINFMNTVKDEKIFLISSGRVGQRAIPLVHHMIQLNRIYIFCENQHRHEEWTRNWSKIQDVYTDIIPICKALKKAVQDCDQNSVSISLVKTIHHSSNEIFDRLGQSFMYTQILKEILLNINFQQEHIHQFCQYCREQLIDNHIDKFENEYKHYDPIWWYTNDCFLYSMLNRALRLMEIDLIIKMGFFLRDLHNYIVKLHSEQFNRYHSMESFTVYRGQGLSQIDFDQLRNTQGELISFNNFLSTSKNSSISLKFARRMIATSDLIGVLFVMKIDPLISATPYANVRNISCHQEEDEILFSMHCIFRIEEIKPIGKNHRLWQVDLTLINDNEAQIDALSEHIRDETKAPTPWLRLTKLMIKLEQYNGAEDLLEKLLRQANDQNEIEDIHQQLEYIKLKYELSLIKTH